MELRFVTIEMTDNHTLVVKDLQMLDPILGDWRSIGEDELSKLNLGGC